MNSESNKNADSLLTVRIKPKKRSLVERELETSLTARVTSPVSNDEGNNTSRYGRARRLKKSEADFHDSEINMTKIVKSPTFDNPMIQTQSPTHKMQAAKSDKSTIPRKSFTISNIIDSEIESIYNEDLVLSNLGTAEKQKIPSPVKKMAKIYVRKDLIQKDDADKNRHKLPKTHLGNILERSSEKLGIDVSIAAKSRNTSCNMLSVVKTLDFDKKKKKDTKDSKTVLSKSDLFEIEAKCEYQVGDLAWARMGTYPFWPCIVTREPVSGIFVKKKLFGRVEHDIIHVTFFGDNGRRSWIVDNMLRKYLGILEFEVTREKFTPEAKKRDPRLYAAFFVSEKKQPQWNISVEEAELLLREPKRLRIDTFNEMLAKNRVNKTTPKREKTAKISRTNSDVSLSESLYDTLFSEDDGKSDEFDRSRNRCKNKSLDVSEVVTACLDDMAAKTGINRIHKQSHMDRWLQKAKSKTPEKSQSKCQSPLLNSETKVDDGNAKRKISSQNPIVKQTENNGKKSVTESQHTSRKSPRGVNNDSWSSITPYLENEAHKLHVTTINNENETLFKNMPQHDSKSGIGIICKVETLCAQTQKDMCSKNHTEGCIETKEIDYGNVSKKFDKEVNSENSITTNDGLPSHKEENNEFYKTKEINSGVKNVTVVENNVLKSQLYHEHNTHEKFVHEETRNAKTTFDTDNFQNCSVKTLFSSAVLVLSNQNTRPHIDSPNSDMKADIEEYNINKNYVSKDDTRMSEEKERITKKSDKNKQGCLVQNYFEKSSAGGVQENMCQENIHKKENINDMIKSINDSNSFIQNNILDKCNNLVANVTINSDDSLLCKSFHENQYKPNVPNIIQNCFSKQLPNLVIESNIQSGKMSNNIKKKLTTNTGMKSEVDYKKTQFGNKNLNQVSKTQPEIIYDRNDIQFKDAERDVPKIINIKMTEKGWCPSVKFSLLNGDIEKSQNISDSTQCNVKITNGYSENVDKAKNKSDEQMKSKLLDNNEHARKKFDNLKELNLEITPSSISKSKYGENERHGNQMEPVRNSNEINMVTEHIPEHFINNNKEFVRSPDTLTESNESVDLAKTDMVSNRYINADMEADISVVSNNIEVPVNVLNEESTTINDEMKVSNSVEEKDKHAGSSQMATSDTLVEKSSFVSPKSGLRAASINSIPREVPPHKHQDRSQTSCTFSAMEFNKNYDLSNILRNNPEFRNYFELRQDVLMDENPQLTQYEILSYLYKTWMYEGNGKCINNKINDSAPKETDQNLSLPKKSKKHVKVNRTPNGNVGKYQAHYNASPTHSVNNKEKHCSDLKNYVKPIVQKEVDLEIKSVSTDDSEIINITRNVCSRSKINLAASMLFDKTEIKDLNFTEYLDMKQDVLHKNPQVPKNDFMKKKNKTSDCEKYLTVSISDEISVKDLNTETLAQDMINKTAVKTDNQSEVGENKCVLVDKIKSEVVKSTPEKNANLKTSFERNEDLETAIVKSEDSDTFVGKRKHRQKNKVPPVSTKGSSENKHSEIDFLNLAGSEESKSKLSSKKHRQVSSLPSNVKNDLANMHHKSALEHSIKNKETHCSEPNNCIMSIVKKEVDLEIQSVTTDDSDIIGIKRNICSKTDMKFAGNIFDLTKVAETKIPEYLDVKRGLSEKKSQLAENRSIAKLNKISDCKNDLNIVSLSDDITAKDSNDGTSCQEIINSIKVKLEKDSEDREKKSPADKITSDFVKSISESNEVLKTRLQINKDSETVTVKREDSKTSVNKRKVRIKNKLTSMSTKGSSENKHLESAFLDSTDSDVSSEKPEFSTKKHRQVSITQANEKNYLAKALENPDFCNYLELRQDVLMDENPQLTQDEIVRYLYKTWTYEDNSKTATDKCDDIAVKGLNVEPVPQPKKYKKKIKLEKEPIIRIEDIMYRDKPKRTTAKPLYIKDYSDVEDEIECFEIVNHVDLKQDMESKGNISKKKPVLEISNISNQQGTNEKVIDLDETEDFDDEDLEEMYFAQLTKSKPNIFKGLVREKVCDLCEKPGNLAKCTGCHNMFHVDCATKKEEVGEVEVLKRGRKKRKKPKSKTPKSLNDSGGQESGSQSDDKSHDPNVSEDGQNKYLDEISNLSPTIVADADNFEEQLSLKMKEILETFKNEDYETASDCELDWSSTVAGKCEIVDVKLKLKSENNPENIENSNLKCLNCQKYDVPVCFVCKSNESPKNKIEYRQRCQVAHCYKYYHLECLDHWPQTQFNSGEPSRNSKKVNQQFEGFMCPKHVCHTCVSDDPRGCKTRFSGDKLARCVRCPATYHSLTKCLPAGSQILTGSHIICPRHYEHRPGKVPCHVNTGWCFICALGGSLICCEYCPTSFHAECLNIKPPEGGYMCEDCETGRLPLYGEMVWVKLGHYRWWPGIILHPSEIPENILSVKHSFGEFVVRFFGQYDHYWVNRGRVFPFQEGDSGRISSQKSKIDEAFTKAINHANRACEILKGIPPNEVEHQELASTLLPPHYVKLKVNKPCGSLCGRKLDIEEHSLTQCECDPMVEDPCGPYSQCLNRMLLTECGPSCRAGDRCNNRAFEKRLYPKMVPYPTPHRGWGLKTLQDIKQGQFVIEYVGELIDEEEFKRRMRRQHEIRDENFYFLTLDKERMIDAGPKGNLARFMNHCCEPNCETQKWTVLGDVRVGLFAIRDIPANSEVTFNYNLECAGIEKKQCMCGAKRCSGYIGAKPKQDDSQTKKTKPTTKRPYKKRKPEESPSTPKTQPKPRKPKVVKPRELTEIEKDLLIIKNATNGLSSDSECSSRLSSIDDKKYQKPTKRKRVSFSTEEIIIYNGKVSPSVKRVKLNNGKSNDVGD